MLRTKRLQCAPCIFLCPKACLTTAGHLKQDADTLAAWEVDYVKVDGCWASADTYADDYSAFARYLNHTGRPIVYSCSWPAYLPDPVQTGYQVSGHLW